MGARGIKEAIMTPETLSLAEHACFFLNKATELVRKDTKDVVASKDHIEIIKHYARVRQVTEQIKEAREALDEMEKALSREYVPETMREHNVKTITLEGIGRVSLSNRWSCSMIDKPLSMDWLRNSGNGALIQETVNSQTLAAFAKDLNDTKGEELPTDLFKTSIMTVTSITKA
jgi:hypothetical protein